MKQRANSESESVQLGPLPEMDAVPISGSASMSPTTFYSLGLIAPRLEALIEVGYTKPTEIQSGSIPHALESKDIIGVAETGSGKTAAFALPVLQKLWDEPKGLLGTEWFANRELAYQIAQQFEALGSAIGVRCATIVAGMDMMSLEYCAGSHVIVTTLGRLNDHLENTKGFSLPGLRYLVLDEADRLLDMDFGPVIDKILKVLPRERNTFLFSATMSTKVAKLQRASIRNPVRVEVNGIYSTVSTLLQYYLLTPFINKDVHLVHLANELAANSVIVFTRTVHDAQRLSMVLRNLGFPAVPLHGQLSQSARLGALNNFKTGGRSLLIATDVASRCVPSYRFDIPAVEVVINFDIPTHSKAYIHRVGRTARAGQAGKCVTLVTQYYVELLQRIEGVIGKKMMDFGVDKAGVILL
ncbi:P-loop containing nucleoside triphosphate hydrolase protein [Ceratobasidium sp. AG-I]|nr:P-loop containing nucleoside triphosphate hydrolase protein [Ceratobasidium sp. AG-I]